jgi:hypothetical protein
MQFDTCKIFSHHIFALLCGDAFTLTSSAIPVKVMGETTVSRWVSTFVRYTGCHGYFRAYFLNRV